MTVSHDCSLPADVTEGRCIRIFVVVMDCKVFRRKDEVTDLLWLEIGMTIVICQDLALLVETSSLMLIRYVSLVIRTSEAF